LAHDGAQRATSSSSRIVSSMTGAVVNLRMLLRVRMRSLLGAESSAGDEPALLAARIVRLHDVAGEAQRRAPGAHAAQGLAPGS
jgi:hypothetical protein